MSLSESKVVLVVVVVGGGGGGCFLETGSHCVTLAGLEVYYIDQAGLPLPF